MAKIFVEGLPAAGKTSLIKFLEIKGYPVVHELGRVLPQTAFPGNGKNLEHMIKINKWFIEQESNRFVHHPDTAYDRSYLTHLSYAYAYSKYTGIIGFNLTINQYNSAIVNKLLVYPDSVIYLDISPEESIKRQITRTKREEQPALPTFWRDKKFLQDLKTADAALFKSMNNIQILKICANDTNKDKYNQVKLYLTKTSFDKNIDLEKYISLLSD